MNNEPSPDLRIFSTLAEACDFLADCIQSQDAYRLFAACHHRSKPHQNSVAGREYFTNFVFPVLQDLQTEQDFRLRYTGISFPDNSSHHKLGGHFSELGCTHVDFEKIDAGWVLDEIWICR